MMLALALAGAGHARVPLALPEYLDPKEERWWAYLIGAKRALEAVQSLITSRPHGTGSSVRLRQMRAS